MDTSKTSGEIALVTGSSGEIGFAITSYLRERGFIVIGVDKDSSPLSQCDFFVKIDLFDVATSTKSRDSFFLKIREYLNGQKINLLVNNAATQILESFDMTDIDNYIYSQTVNCAAPLALYRFFEDDLINSNGSTVNIGSVHSILTKKRFGLYAASKASLRSLTKSLAINNDGAVAIYSIEPAAIETKMLKDGFQNKKEELRKLASFHPVGIIGSTVDVAKVVYWLHSSDIKFLHGTSVDLSGGISNLLHDPF